MDKTITLSDRIGYVYWFSVLVTIHFGFATGVFVTHQNKMEMIETCHEKILFYEQHHPEIIASYFNMISDNQSLIENVENLNEMILRTKFYDTYLRYTHRLY